MIRTAALVALVFAGCESGAQTVTVPDVNGLRRTEAQCAIVDAGLRWRDVDESSSHDEAKFCSPDDGASAPDPDVLRQRPPAGRNVARGTTVVLETACSRRRACD